MIHGFCKVFVDYIVSKQLAETFINIFRRFLQHELIIVIINSCLCLSVVFIANLCISFLLVFLGKSSKKCRGEIQVGNCCKYRTLWSWTGEIIYQVLGEKNARLAFLYFFWLIV